MLPPKFLIFIAFVASKVNALANLIEVFAWKELPFAWPSEGAKYAAIQNGDYIPAHNLPLGMDRWRDKLFVTIPRWKTGTPASLGYISLSQPYHKSPAVIPYPSWEANALPKDNVNLDHHIISPYRVAVDACDRLWVMDMGLVNILGKTDVISPPAIIIYDLITDQLIRRYVLGDKVIEPHSFLPNIVIDSNKNKCDDAYAYISDVTGYALIVYSLKHNDSWKFKHNFFHIDPLNADYNVGGVNFQWTDGVFGLALGPEDEQCFRTVYFHPTSSLNEFSVSSAVLKNKTLASSPHIHHLFTLEGSKGENSQTTVSVFDEISNTLFFAQINRDAVACWNPSRPLTPSNVALVAQDPKNLIFTNEIRIDDNRELWILSNKMPTFLYSKLNEEEVNYRIFKVKVDDAIAGTPCDTSLPILFLPRYY